MKNRKLVIIAFVLCAALLMGIGYADLVGYLSIGHNMTLTKDNNDMKVVFTSAQMKEGDASKGTAKVNTDPTTATVEVTGLSAKGDHATAMFTIKNNTPDVTATIKIKAINVEGDFAITDTFDDAAGTAEVIGTAEDGTITLAPNAEYSFSITVTLEQTVTENHSHSFSVDFDVTGAASN